MDEDRIQYVIKQQEYLSDKLRGDKYNSMKYYENVIGDLNSKVRMLQSE